VSGVRRKIETILARLGRLKDELGNAAGDGGESNRRKNLFEWVSFDLCGRSSILPHPRALERITDELQPLSERSSALDYHETDSDGQFISELAEDLRDAVMEYQVGLGPPVSCRMLRCCAVRSTEIVI